MATKLPPAAILSGGLGTRIRAVAGSTPKVLLPVEGRPFLAHLLEYLSGQGVEKAVLCLGHGAPQIRDAAETHAPEGMTLIESVEAEPLGTAGAVKLALGHLDDTFFLVNGDTFVEAPLARLLELHRSRSAAVTLSLVRSDEVAEKGSVRIAPDGRVLDFAEKTEGSSGLINAGVYVVEPRVFEACPPGVSCSLERQIIPDLLSAENELVLGLIVEAPFVDIGLPEEYLRVRDQLPKSGGGRP